MYSRNKRSKSNKIFVNKNVYLKNYKQKSPESNNSKFLLDQNFNSLQKVLSPVFLNLPFESLLTSRLVCSAWNAIISNPQTSKFPHIAQVSFENTGDLNSDLEIFNNSKYQTFFHFRFDTLELDNSTPTQEEFWRIYGPQIKSLELLSHTLSSFQLLNILSACLHLESFTLSCSNIYGSEIWKNKSGELSRHKLARSICLVDNVVEMRKCGVLRNLKELKILHSNNLPPGVLRDFLRLASSLSSLSLIDEFSSLPPDWDVGTILKFLVKRPYVLRKLELSGSNIYPEFISALGTIKGVNLTHAHFRYGRITDSSLVTFLKAQRNLVELDLSFTPITQRPFLHTLTSFDKLKRLILRGFGPCLTSFAFLSRMPNLEEFELSYSHQDNCLNWDKLINALLPIRLRKLKSLNLRNNSGLGIFPRLFLFKSLLGTFSHITCLNLSENSFLKDAFLLNLWIHLRFLKVVFLERLSGITTEGITGIRQSQMAALLSLEIDKRPDPDLVRNHGSETEGSYIGLCRRIKILSLSHNSRLNDLCVKFGIKELSHLQKLKLDGCHKISSRSLIELMKYCPKLDYLDLSGTSIEIKSINWAKSIKPSLKIHQMVTDLEEDCPIIENFEIIDDNDESFSYSKSYNFLRPEPRKLVLVDRNSSLQRRKSSVVTRGKYDYGTRKKSQLRLHGRNRRALIVPNGLIRSETDFIHQNNHINNGGEKRGGKRMSEIIIGGSRIDNAENFSFEHAKNLPGFRSKAYYK